MTPVEIRARLISKCAAIGEHAYITLSFNQTKWDRRKTTAIHASVYSYYPQGGVLFDVDTDDFADLFTRIDEGWATHKAENDVRVTRLMAIEIIKITADRGACTDRDLRVTFTPDDVTRLGPAACADADKMVSNGPFTIKPTPGANARGNDGADE